MSSYCIKRIDDMEASFGGAMKKARAELGVTSFGVQVIDLPPNLEAYPEHDHAQDGQEEVYLAVRGGCEIEIEGERHSLDADTMIRVGPGVMRKIWPGESGVRLIAIGGVPGATYEVKDSTELGAPDPLAR